MNCACFQFSWVASASPIKLNGGSGDTYLQQGVLRRRLAAGIHPLCPLLDNKCNLMTLMTTYDMCVCVLSSLVVILDQKSFLLVSSLRLVLQQRLHDLLLLNKERPNNAVLNTAAAPGAAVRAGYGEGALLLLAVEGGLEVRDAGEGALAVTALGARGLLGPNNSSKATSGGLDLLDDIGLGGKGVP